MASVASASPTPLQHACMQMAEFERECYIREYEYQAVWEETIGETFSCVREPTNPSDGYSFAVIRNETIVGHLPVSARSLGLYLNRE